MEHEWMLDVLKELAEKFQPELFQRVRKELEPRESRLLDDVFETYYQKEKSRSRWYDPYHVLSSTIFAVHLRESDEPVSPLIVPAIILHDIGYIVLPDEAKEKWNVAQNRILHMQEGAAIAAKSLAQIDLYNPFEIGIIVEMVATHDNGYLGIKTRDQDCLALRDADRIWVMHLISFYKDWISKRREKEDFSLQDLISQREISFYKEEIPFTNLAKQWIDRQLQIRGQEIQDSICHNENIFREYAESHIQSEIVAGRG